MVLEFAVKAKNEETARSVGIQVLDALRIFFDVDTLGGWAEYQPSGPKTPNVWLVKVYTPIPPVDGINLLKGLEHLSAAFRWIRFEQKEAQGRIPHADSIDLREGDSR